MMVASVRFVVALLTGVCVAAMPSLAAEPKYDKDTCAQFHTEQAKFIESGILADLARGADWGKTNLSADRLREIEHYITLDEQTKFACREATLTPEMLNLEEIARRLEANPNADPFAPPAPPAAQADDSGEDNATATPDDGTVKKKRKPAAKPVTQAKPKPPAAKAVKPASSKTLDDAYKAPSVADTAPPEAKPIAPSTATR